jgi:hypothetical protein
VKSEGKCGNGSPKPDGTRMQALIFDCPFLPHSPLPTANSKLDSGYIDAKYRDYAIFRIYMVVSLGHGYLFYCYAFRYVASIVVF